MQLKYIEDYYAQVKERFPDLEDWEIDRILKHGMRSFFTLNAKGADVLIRSAHNAFTMFFGKLFSTKEKSVNYYYLKWRIKLRIKYSHATKVWDGNYYFGLTEEEYKKYIPQKKGRIKNKIVFNDILAYKIKEEAFLNTHDVYFYKLSVPEEKGYVIPLDNYETRNITLIAKRDNEGKVRYINE